MDSAIAQGPSFVMGIAFFLVWLVMMVGMVATWVIIVIAIWRAMKAHESIAGSLREMANKPG